MQSILLGEEIKSIAYVLGIVIMGAVMYIPFCQSSYLLRKIISCVLGAFILTASIMFFGYNQVDIEKDAINSKIEYVKRMEYAQINTLVGIHKIENTLLSYEFIVEDKLESEEKSKVLWLYVYEKSNTTVPAQKVKLRKLLNGQLEIIEWLSVEENNKYQTGW